MEISNIWELIGIIVLIGVVVVGLGLAAFMRWFNSMYRERESDVDDVEKADPLIRVEAKAAKQSSGEETILCVLVKHVRTL